jgi:YihY family inner membrane protein
LTGSSTQGDDTEQLAWMWMRAGNAVGMVGERGNVVERVVRRFDRFQQAHAPLAFAYAVVKKFGEDRGSQLAGLIAFYGFLSFFPLMLVLVTLTSFLAHGNPHLANQIRDSALNQFPVVGPDLAGHDKALPGSGLGLAVGLIGLVWGALGVTQTVQYAFAEVWHVPYKDRASFFVRVFRGLVLFVVLGCGVVVTVGLASLGAVIGSSLLAGAAGLVSATALSIALYLVVFRMLSPKHLRWWDLLPGAVVAGVGWQVLETVGVQLVQRQLRHSSQLYGTVGVVLGLIFFLVLVAQLTLYGLEINAVRVGRLWPRSLVQPPLTDADRVMLRTMAHQEERRPEQRVTVDFGGDATPRDVG